MNVVLSQKFIESMQETNTLYSVLYIKALSTSDGKISYICPKETSRLWNVSETEVICAFQYWQAKRFIHLIFEEKLKVEFIDNINENTLNTIESPAKDNSIVHIDFAKEKTNKFKKTENDDEVVKEEELEETEFENFCNNISYNYKEYDKPYYSPTEIEMYKDNAIINRLFTKAEKYFGRLLKSDEQSTILGFYDWIRMPTEVIDFLLYYCSENNYKNFKDVEKLAMILADNYIDTKDEAKKYLSNSNNLLNTKEKHKEILKAIGAFGRNLTPAETVYVDRWFNEYSYNLDMVLEALDKTVINNGKPSFSYTEKILKNWHDAGIRSVEQIALYESNFYETNLKNKSKKKTKSQSNKFSNFTPTKKIDYSYLDNIGFEEITNV
ncbi:MAG: DnaD domain protein [Defluviitaleaceae bacterium]|nr:DnaD domain protein [Defluviitaleaceae bacterium]